MDVFIVHTHPRRHEGRIAPVKRPLALAPCEEAQRHNHRVEDDAYERDDEQGDLLALSEGKLEYHNFVIFFPLSKGLKGGGGVTPPPEKWMTRNTQACLSADEEGPWEKLNTRNGGRFVNGPSGPFSSLYLYACVVCVISRKECERGRGTDGDKEYDHPPSSQIERDIRVAGWLLIGIPVFFFLSFPP